MFCTLHVDCQAAYRPKAVKGSSSDGIGVFPYRLFSGGLGFSDFLMAFLSTPLTDYTQVYSNDYIEAIQNLDAQHYSFLNLAPSDPPDITLDTLRHITTHHKSLSPFISQSFLNSTQGALEYTRTKIRRILEGQADLVRQLKLHDAAMQAVLDQVARLDKIPRVPFQPFPLDVAELIVEKAAGTDDESALALSVVSKEVSSWVDTQLFKQIDVPAYNDLEPLAFLICGDAESDAQETSSRVLHSLSHYTTGISMHDTPYRDDFFIKLFSRCPNLVSLSILENSREFVFPVPTSSPSTKDEGGGSSQIVSIPPKLSRLACPGSHIFGDKQLVEDDDDVANPGTEGFSHPLFRQITHLQITSSSNDDWDMPHLSSLTSLTHLYIDFSHLDMISDLDSFVAIFGDALPPSLLICLLRVELDLREDTEDSFSDLQYGRVDKRLLLCSDQCKSCWDDAGLVDELEWIFCVGEYDDGGPLERVWRIDCTDMELKHEVWDKGVELMNRRNLALGVK